MQQRPRRLKLTPIRKSESSPCGISATVAQYKAKCLDTNCIMSKLTGFAMNEQTPPLQDRGMSESGLLVVSMTTGTPETSPARHAFSQQFEPLFPRHVDVHRDQPRSFRTVKITFAAKKIRAPSPASTAPTPSNIGQSLNASFSNTDIVHPLAYREILKIQPTRTGQTVSNHPEALRESTIPIRLNSESLIRHALSTINECRYVHPELDATSESPTPQPETGTQK